MRGHDTGLQWEEGWAPPWLCPDSLFAHGREKGQDFRSLGSYSVLLKMGARGSKQPEEINTRASDKTPHTPKVGVEERHWEVADIYFSHHFFLVQLLGTYALTHTRQARCHQLQLSPFDSLLLETRFH